MLKPLHWLSIYFSDIIVGISNDTLNQFIKSRHLGKRKVVVLYYGIDLDRFDININPATLRIQLNLPLEAKLILFSGRMNSFKNPVFVVKILKELLKKDTNYYAIFVGEGDLSKDVELIAKQKNISDNIRLLGWITNLPFVMKSADVFVFPRLENPKEGLGLVVVEAQSAGLPMLLSLPENLLLPLQ